MTNRQNVTISLSLLYIPFVLVITAGQHVKAATFFKVSIAMEISMMIRGSGISITVNVASQPTILATMVRAMSNLYVSPLIRRGGANAMMGTS